MMVSSTAKPDPIHLFNRLFCFPHKYVVITVSRISGL